MRTRWLAAVGCAVGACFSPTAPNGLPCGEDLSCPAGQSCDLISNECGTASEALILRDDTAADFAMTGAYTAEVAIEAQGFVGPIPYGTGLVRTTGYDGLLLDDLDTASFEAITATAKKGTAFERSSRILFQATRPPGLDIEADGSTITIEGEIDLDAVGSWRFQLVANDQGFFEIAEPGSDMFQRIVQDVNAGTVGTFVSTQTGWHRFRAAFQDAGNFFDFDLQYDPPNVMGNGFREIPSDFLRTPVTDVSGLVVDGFEHANLLFHRGTIVSRDPLTDVSLGVDAFEIPVGISFFSYRWSGQFLVDDAGDYTFALDSTGGHRLVIDGVLVADAFSFSPESSTTEPITLAPGWHDLVLDLNKEGGSGPGRIAFSVTSGQYAQGVIPADHLRPVIGRATRFVADRNTTPLPIPDGTGTPAIRSIGLDLPASLITAHEIVAAIDVTADNLGTIELQINPPAGATVIVAPFGSMTGTEAFLHVPLAPSNLGTSWQFIGTDNLPDLQVGSIDNVYLTVGYAGGIAPFATTYRYESAVRDLGDAVAFERIAWTTRQAADASAVIVKLRTCDTAEACAGEPYIEVENATVPNVVPRGFVQYAVEMTSNGEVPTALDAIELRYFVRGTD